MTATGLQHYGKHVVCSGSYVSNIELYITAGLLPSTINHWQGAVYGAMSTTLAMYGYVYILLFADAGDGHRDRAMRQGTAGLETSDTSVKSKLERSCGATEVT
jgi:hypothetical protein